jgi:Zn-dependent protease with chaperone function
MSRLCSLVVVTLVCVATVLPGEREKVELEGYAEWRSGDFLIVDGQRVRPRDGMKFDGKAGARGFASIPIGYEVKVEGRRASDGSVVADRVEAKPNGIAWLERDVALEFDAIEESWRRAGCVFEDENEEDEEDDETLGTLHESGFGVERIRRITRRLVPPYADPEDFRVYVVDNEEWNAMAGPNGAIFVYRGLLDAMDDDELALVLGHEIAHVTHEHSRKAIKKSFFIELLTLSGLAAVDSKVESETERQMIGLAAMLGGLAWANGYGRGQEDQADRVGLRYAYEGGFDVTKAPALWRKFAEKYRGSNRVVDFFFSNHSASSARARNLEHEITMNYADR